MYEWKDVTGYFDEDRRHYKNMYLEIDEVYNDEVEVSLFSSKEELFEIYVCYGKMHGIVYAKEKDAYKVREDIKKDLEKAYDKSKEPTKEYINWFVDKYDLKLPIDTYFDIDLS